jgi:O-antigen ligase
VVVLLTVPLLTHQIYEKYEDEIDFLPFSSKHRLVIWSYTSELVQAEPFLGRGLRAAHSSELVDLDGEGNAKRIQLTEDRNISRSVAHHPHNMALQIWLEFGLVGVGLSIALILVFFRFLGTLTASIQRFALASVAAFTVIFLVGYGLWQSWLLGVALWTLLAFTMLDVQENSREDK